MTNPQNTTKKERTMMTTSLHRSSHRHKAKEVQEEWNGHNSLQSLRIRHHNIILKPKPKSIQKSLIKKNRCSLTKLGLQWGEALWVVPSEASQALPLAVFTTDQLVW
jgi:hypothetical protein